jgi:hypothetical protein
MGGQACILYGAAEFSRDVDIAVLASASNLDHLRAALAELAAEPVYFPVLGLDVLQRGHACHFRARAPGVEGIRIDVMSVMHRCDSFEVLWRRRRQLNLPALGRVNVLALPDLVQAKKTQRDKDWPMVRRLVEADYANRPRRPSATQVEFWLREVRTSALLVELCQKYPARARRIAGERPAVRHALIGDIRKIERALQQEENVLRTADRLYWQPLRAELFEWRRQARLSS